MTRAILMFTEMPVVLGLSRLALNRDRVPRRSVSQSDLQFFSTQNQAVAARDGRLFAGLYSEVGA